MVAMADLMLFIASGLNVAWIWFVFGIGRFGFCRRAFRRRRHRAASSGSSGSALCGRPASVAGALSWRFCKVPFMTCEIFTRTLRTLQTVFLLFL